MKTTYKLSIVALLFVVALGVSAQGLPKLGIEAGINLSNSSFDADPLDKKAKVGFQVGLTADFEITEALHLQSGLAFTTKGSKIEGTSQLGNGNSVKGEVKVNQSYLQLPVYLAYKIEVVPGTRIVFNAGPYVALGVGGKTKISGSFGGDDNFLELGEGEGDTFGDEGFLKRFDFGLGAGAGVELGNVVVTLRYELGLLNVSQFEEFDYKNRNASLTLGYRF